MSPTAKIPRTIIRDIDAVDGVLRASGTRFAPTEKSSHSSRLEPMGSSLQLQKYPGQKSGVLMQLMGVEPTRVLPH